MSTIIFFPYWRNSAHSLWCVLSFIRCISWKKTNLNKSEHDCFKLKCLLRLQWVGQLGGRMAALCLEVLGLNFRQSQLSLLGFVTVPTIFPRNFHGNTLLIRASSDSLPLLNPQHYYHTFTDYSVQPPWKTSLLKLSVKQCNLMERKKRKMRMENNTIWLMDMILCWAKIL
jgi:hypothetical protein